MKIPNSSSFGIGNILGLIFLLVGILLVLNLIDFELPIDLEGANTFIQYGAALGSIFGGLSMLFKKKTTKTIARVPVQ